MSVAEAELITDVAALAALAAEWDEVAVAAALPQMSPAWVLAWWRHLAPTDAEPRTIAVRDRGELIGVAPFYVRAGARGRVDYRLPGIELTARLAPVARPDREWDVAAAIAGAFREAEPRPDLVALEGAPLASPWPTALRERWPGVVRPIVRRYTLHHCPVVELDLPSFEDWFARRSPNFRRRLRVVRRNFLAAGGTVRFATAPTLRADVDTLMRLHAARWSTLSETIGTSNLVARADRMPAFLHAVGEQLADAGRFRLVVLEIDGEPISAHLAVAAGGEVLAVNGGWDERWARLSPTVHCVQTLIEDGFARGDRRIDLGLGAQAYKLRFADGDSPVAWMVVLAPGPRLALTGARTAPMLARYAGRDAIKRALGPDRLRRARDLRRRLRVP